MKRKKLLGWISDGIAMPGNKSKQQHLRLLGHILNEMQQENPVRSNGRFFDIYRIATFDLL